MKIETILNVLDVLNKRSKSIVENVNTVFDIVQNQIPNKLSNGATALEPVKEMYQSISTTLKLVKQLEEAGLIDVDSKGFFLREIILSIINKIDKTGRWEEIEKLSLILSNYAEWLKKLSQIRLKTDSKDVLDLTQKLIKGLL